MRFRSYLPLILCEGFCLHWYGGVHSGTLHWSPPFPSDICCPLPSRVGQLQVYLLTEITSWDFNIFCWLCPLRSKLTRPVGGIFIKVAQDNSCRTHKASDYSLKKGLNKLEFSFNKPPKVMKLNRLDLWLLTWPEASSRDGTWRFIPGFSTLVHFCDLVEKIFVSDTRSSTRNSSRDWNWIFSALSTPKNNIRTT